MEYWVVEVENVGVMSLNILKVRKGNKFPYFGIKSPFSRSVDTYYIMSERTAEVLIDKYCDGKIRRLPEEIAIPRGKYLVLYYFDDEECDWLPIIGYMGGKLKVISKHKTYKNAVKSADAYFKTKPLKIGKRRR